MQVVGCYTNTVLYWSAVSAVVELQEPAGPAEIKVLVPQLARGFLRKVLLSLVPYGSLSLSFSGVRFCESVLLYAR